MYRKNAAKPISGNIQVLRVIFGLADSVEYTIEFLHLQLTAEKVRLLQLYVLSIFHWVILTYWRLRKNYHPLIQSLQIDEMGVK